MKHCLWCDSSETQRWGNMHTIHECVSCSRCVSYQKNETRHDFTEDKQFIGVPDGMLLAGRPMQMGFLCHQCKHPLSFEVVSLPIHIYVKYYCARCKDSWVTMDGLFYGGEPGHLHSGMKECV